MEKSTKYPQAILEKKFRDFLTLKLNPNYSDFHSEFYSEADKESDQSDLLDESIRDFLRRRYMSYDDFEQLACLEFRNESDVFTYISEIYEFIFEAGEKPDVNKYLDGYEI